MFPKALNLYLGSSGAESGDCPCSYTFLLIHLCRNVTVCFYLCFCRQLRWFCEKKLTKKIIFYCNDEALKVFRKYRCHPVWLYWVIFTYGYGCKVGKQWQHISKIISSSKKYGCKGGQLQPYRYIGGDVLYTCIFFCAVRFFSSLVSAREDAILKVNWARIFKRLWSPGIDSKEWIPPAYVAWRAGTITLFLLGS